MSLGQNKTDICFVTRNENKLKEITKLAPPQLGVYSLKKLNFDEDIEETGATIAENSAIKASFIHHRFNIPCFADDTGLEVFALNGEPGVYSARYAGDESNSDANMDLLLKNMSSLANRNARFLTVISYIDQNGNQYQFEGIAEGEILTEKQGTRGFGYDPIFLPHGYEKTFAEISMEEKNKISHRAKAFNKFFSFLSSRL